MAKVNYLLLFIFVVLMIWGMLAVSTVSFSFSLQGYGTPWYYLWHQLIMVVVGLLVGFFFFKLPLQSLKKMAPWFFLVNLCLVWLVFLPKIGVSAGGAKRWLSVAGVLFQPSEILKITFLLYLSAWLANRTAEKAKKSFNQLLLPFLGMLIILAVALIAQPDLSTLIIIGATGAVVYFMASTPLLHTLILAGGGSALVALFILKAPYRLSRLLTFLHPEKDPLGTGYQLRQCLIALGSGKLTGIGEGFSLGLSRQKLGFVPHSMTDSIFAIIGEEIGFLGTITLICLFVLLALLGFRIAMKQRDNFAKFLGLGIAFWLTFQAFFNIGGIIGILPMGGVPLPFFSYGGSHLIAELAGAGILLNISKQKI